MEILAPYYKRSMRARVRADNQDAQEDQTLLAELDAREADNDSEEVLVWEDAPEGGVPAQLEELGAGRRRRCRTKHRTKRRTVRPALIKHLNARITRLMR